MRSISLRAQEHDALFDRLLNVRLSSSHQKRKEPSDHRTRNPEKQDHLCADRGTDCAPRPRSFASRRKAPANCIPVGYEPQEHECVEAEED